MECVNRGHADSSGTTVLHSAIMPDSLQHSLAMPSREERQAMAAEEARQAQEQQENALQPPPE